MGSQPSHGRAGETDMIAALTREVAQAQGADPHRIYIAGLSAGGAMAAVVAALYRDLFCALGAHSGLPTGAANDVTSALSAMRRAATEVTPHLSSADPDFLPPPLGEGWGGGIAHHRLVIMRRPSPPKRQGALLRPRFPPSPSGGGPRWGIAHHRLVIMRRPSPPKREGALLRPRFHPSPSGGGLGWGHRAAPPCHHAQAFSIAQAPAGQRSPTMSTSMAAAASSHRHAHHLPP